MPIDREATLKNAAKLLRGGRLDAAIAEYARVVDDDPGDWNTAKTLGDLYLREGKPQQAIVLYGRIADHLLSEGFFPKAAALFKKILKIAPGHEHAELRLAETSQRQGLLAVARAHYTAVEKRRRQRGDMPGADEIAARLDTLHPEDPDAALPAPPVSEPARTKKAAGDRYREQYEQYIEEGLYRDARRVIEEATGSETASSGDVLALGWTYCDSNPDAAAICVDVVTDALVAAGAFAEAVALLEESAARLPNRVPTLLRLVEVCVDAGLEETMFRAQAQLADAYLASGRANEARVIAEDLVSRDPSNAGHLARLRRSQQQAGADDAESVITLSATLDDEESFGALLDVQLPEGRREQARRDPGAAKARVEPLTDAPAARRESVEIDLTSMVGELQSRTQGPTLPARPRELDEVFADIRTEVSGNDAADASADHLALARTYLEMGELAEAAGSLEVAARSPQLRFTAATMLAEIRRDEGNLPEAIEWFERAAEAPPPGPDEGRALLYDLGDVLETVGETARALAVFLELDADAPEYRDVRDRVTRLSRMETEG